MLSLQLCFIDTNKLNYCMLHTVETPKADNRSKYPTEYHKEIEGLNNTINQLDLIDIYKALHLTIREIHYLQCTWNIFQDKP